MKLMAAVALLLPSLMAAGPGNQALSTRRNLVNLFYLADTLQPLTDHFNSEKGKLRFVALLSPT